MTHTFRSALALMLLVALAATTGLAQKPAPADVQLKAAITKETVDGDLKAAIEMYRTLAKGADRVVAAKALLRMGQCYEKLGDTESRKAYEQLVREFGDQKDVVDQARARLAALGVSKGGATVSVAKVSDTEALAISGDGRYVADGASGEMGRPGTPRPVLSIRDLVRGDVRVLREEAQGWVEAGAAFSPNGRQIAYAWYSNGSGFLELRVSSIDGSGEPRMVFRCNKDIPWLIPSGWSPDGKSILSLLLAAKQKATSIALIDVADGSVRELKRIEGLWSAGHPAMSPDGAYVAYARAFHAEVQQRDIMILSTADLSERSLIENPADDDQPVWTPDGKSVVFRSDRRGTTDLWLQGVAGGQPTGEPQMVRAEIGQVTLLGISRTGTLAYNSKTSFRFGFTVPFDPLTGQAGTAVRLGDRVIFPGAPFWSPDGRTLALLRPAPERLALYTVATGAERELPLDVSRPILSGWFPDGRSVLIAGADGQGHDAFIRYYLDPPRVERLPTMGFRWKRVSIAPDGKVAFAAVGGGKGASISAFDVASGQTRVITATGSYVPSVAASPDGRQIAYIEAPDDDAKGTALWMVDAAGGTPRRVAVLPLATPGLGLAWMPDGRYVLMADYDRPSKKSGIRRVSVADGTFVSTGVALDGISDGLSISPDGRHLAVTGGVSKNEAWVLENFLPKPAAAPGASRVPGAGLPCSRWEAGPYLTRRERYRR